MASVVVDDQKRQAIDFDISNRRQKGDWYALLCK